MPYVTRDVTGKVVAVSELAESPNAELVPAEHPDMVEFMARMTRGEDAGARFMASDLALIRVLEDVVEVLVTKRLIALTDLPAAAQDKLLERRSLRSYLSGMAGVMESGDEGKLI